MGNTLAEVDQALHIVDEVLPLALGGASVFVPAIVPFQGPFLALFQAATKAVDVAAADSGKPLLDVIQDVVGHLTQGQANLPILGPTVSNPTPVA